MRAPAVLARRPAPRSPALVTTAVVLAAAAGAAASPRAGAIAAALSVFAIGWHRTILAWRNLLAALVAIILFIPIGRYTLPGSLPFELEPYRVFVAVLLLMWSTSLLIDSRVRLRRGVLGTPLLLVMATALASVAANPGRIHEYAVGTIVAKRLTFLASFVLVFFMTVGLVRRTRDVQSLVRVIVIGSAGLAAFAIVEYTTGYNVFNDFGKFLPLHAETLPYSLHRGGDRLRVFASSQHPIALGALFVLVLPLTAYLWSETRHRRWWGVATLLLLGCFATQSRTAIVMLIATFLVLLRLRPRAIGKLWPALFPAVLAIHFALPGSLGSLKSAFLPKGGLIAQQQSGKGTYGSGRLADLGPSLSEYAQRPILGEGFATRVTDKGPLQNANILDDQWLSTLLETGVLGVLPWVWIFSRLFQRLRREALTDGSPRGWLCASLAASVLSFAVGMLTFDAFSFIQVTFILFILLGLGAALLEISAAEWRSEERPA